MRRFEGVNPSATTVDAPRGDVHDIPGPDGGWLLGSTLEFRRDLLGLITRGMHEHGDAVRYDVGARGTRLRIGLVVMHHPHDVQQVLTQTERTFTKKTRIFAAMTEMLGSGLLTSTGEDWRRQRRIVQPLFTPRRVEGYLGLMAAEAAALSRTAPTDGATVDLHLMMMRYTLRVVGTGALRRRHRGHGPRARRAGARGVERHPAADVPDDQGAPDLAGAAQPAGPAAQGAAVRDRRRDPAPAPPRPASRRTTRSATTW